MSMPNIISAQNFSLNLPTYDGTLVSTIEEINGRSIREIIGVAQPLYSPVEGLPDEFWKNKRCTSCHEWTQRDLCFQGGVYANGIPAGLHPLGGEFKEILQFWAATGCE